jgi:hypothetical protein
VNPTQLHLAHILAPLFVHPTSCKLFLCAPRGRKPNHNLLVNHAYFSVKLI